MSNMIYIKIMSEDALAYMKTNIDLISEKIMQNDDNKRIYTTFEQPMFVEKKISIDDFELIENPESKDKEIDLKNSLTLYNALKDLPRYILCDERFWLWLYLEKFYKETKSMMKITKTSTVKDHWMQWQGARRGLMFGVLSRCYFRVALTIDESKEDKYELTKWVIDNPLRFSNLTWRAYSSEGHLVRGILKGEKRAIEEFGVKENNDLYPEIAKFISLQGSVRLLDKISEEDIEEITYQKMLSLMK